MNKTRVEALTDGIIAIAATIMVLELGVPAANDWSGIMEIRNIFLAYLISFFMIYMVWYMHHNLFKDAEIITRRSFMINGLWIFMLTLVPFTTAWVGSAPQSFLPEFLYPLTLLLRSLAFHLLEWQIRKDNPGIPKESSTRLPDRLVMYGGFILCMMLAWVNPVFSRYMICIVTLIMGVRMIAGKEERKKQPKR